MGKTHEALKRAEKKYFETLTSPVIPAPPTEKAPRDITDPKGTEFYRNLKTNLFSRYSSSELKSIVFFGTALGDGTTLTAVNFAKNLAIDQGVRVLLADLNFRHPSLHQVFHIETDTTIFDFVNGKDVQVIPQSIPSARLHVLTSTAQKASAPAIYESPRFDVFLKMMTETYDYVVLDAPPVPVYPETCIIASKASGAVMVVNSGKTRTQTAKRAKSNIEQSGGKILGVVLNRREFYIPQWLYKHL
jgi:protein-tyrosine kinase